MKREPILAKYLNPAVFIIGLLILLIAPQFLETFSVKLLTKFLCFAIVAIGLDLLWGYGGMLSLGQGFFFALGGYALAAHLKLENTAEGLLPDFMARTRRETLPSIWNLFETSLGTFIIMLVVPGLLAFLIGFLIFRSRVEGVYFSIITQSLTLIGSLLFVGLNDYTGGTSGITDLKTMFGFDRSDETVITNLYYITVFTIVCAYLLCMYIVKSRFGRLLVATRDDEARVRFLGYNPVIVKTFAFVISALLAAVAGGLFVAQEGSITPSSMGVVESINIVIWVAVGGRYTIIGAIIGALVVNYVNRYMAEAFPETWQFFFGFLFVGVVLLLPKGLFGTFKSLLSGRKSADQSTIADLEPVLSEGAITNE